jgi:hypothetical protein
MVGDSPQHRGVVLSDEFDLPLIERGFLLFGDRAKLEPLLARHKIAAGICEIRHPDAAVSDHDKPSVALRSARQSSMRLAIDAVASGDAAGVVSAGNTGALMAMAKVVLKTLPGIDRPAIASIVPTQRGESVMLDLGANISCDANNLAQFAILGEVFARTVFGMVKPRIALLNVGQEDLKGHSELNAMKVPLIYSLAKSDEDKQALQMFYAQNAFSRPFILPPGVPADRVEALRKIFLETIADPELQAEARKMNIEAVPTSGAELQQIIANMYATSPAIVARVKKGMGR